MEAIKPQPRQRIALISPADILFFGGGAGGGKSYTLLLEAMRHAANPQYEGVIFRRTHPMITAPGGLWEKSYELYPHCGAKPLHGDKWVFPSGATVRFCHMQYEKDKLGWQSSQIPFIGFDEVTEFTESMFWFMLSRNRSTSGIRPYIRAACNPDCESWVATFIAWWIDQETGFPVEDRCGRLRWLVRIDDRFEWASKPGELHEKFPTLVQPPRAKGQAADIKDHRAMPLSVTFIPSLLGDNAALEIKDPSYRSKLSLLPLVERERLLKGNWKIRPAAGLKFPRDKWQLLAAEPTVKFKALCRFWDKAYTEGGAGAMTAGVLVGDLGRDQAIALHLPQFIVLDVNAGRWGDSERESQIQATAALDKAKYGRVTIGVECEGGAGKQAARVTIAGLAGYEAYMETPRTNKAARWTPLAAQQQIGNVGVAPGEWRDEFVRELDLLSGDEQQDKKRLKDKADAASGAFKFLSQGGFSADTELMTSAGIDDRGEPLSEEELAEMDPFWQELIQEHRNHESEREE